MTDENASENENAPHDGIVPVTLPSTKDGIIEKPKRSIYNYILNKQVQYAMLQYFILIITMLLGSCISIIYYFWVRFADSWYKLGMIENNSFMDFLFNQQFLIFPFVLILGIVTLAIFVVDGVRFSHRVVGPIYRLEQHIDKMINSNEVKFEDVVFRDNDHFQGLKEKFNTLMKKLADEKK